MEPSGGEPEPHHGGAEREQHALGQELPHDRPASGADRSRTANSFSRAFARATRRFAALTQAMISTRAAAPKRIRSGCRASPTIRSRRRVAAKLHAAAGLRGRLPRSRDALAEPIEISAQRIERRGRRQPRDRREGAVHPRLGHPGGVGQRPSDWDPYIGVGIGEREAGGHDPDDGEALVVEREGSAGGAGVAAEVGLPERVRDDRDRRVGLARGELPSGHGRDAQDLEQIPRRACHLHIARLPGVGEVWPGRSNRRRCPRRSR